MRLQAICYSTCRRKIGWLLAYHVTVLTINLMREPTIYSTKERRALSLRHKASYIRNVWRFWDAGEEDDVNPYKAQPVSLCWPPPVNRTRVCVRTISTRSCDVLVDNPYPSQHGLCCRPCCPSCWSNYYKGPVEKLIKGMKTVFSSPKLSLRLPKLGGGLHLRAYVDSSFGRNGNLSSKISYVFLLCDELRGWNMLDVSSRKSNSCWVHNGSRGICFLDSLDSFCSIFAYMAYLFDEPLPTFMLPESRQVFDGITQGNRTTEKSMAIKLADVR